MSSILVAYFSAGGVTAGVAKRLAEALGADLFEIRPAVPYTKADLNWMNRRSRSSVEMADPGCRPRTDGRTADMGKYNVVFLGFPIWWGREPSVVDSFLETYDFGGKKIVPFCTSGSSGIGDTAARIRGLTGNKAEVDTGRRLGRRITGKDLLKWAEPLTK